MAPTPSFRMTFSQTAASAAGSLRFAVSRYSGAPAGIFAFWLWQVTQYLSTNALYPSPSGSSQRADGRRDGCEPERRVRVAGWDGRRGLGPSPCPLPEGEGKKN